MYPACMPMGKGTSPESPRARGEGVPRIALRKCDAVPPEAQKRSTLPPRPRAHSTMP